MSGGTSVIVKVVSAGDIEAAKAKFTAQSDVTATTELDKAFGRDGLMAVNETLVAGAATVTTTPNIGDEAAEVNVKSETVYTMLGVKKVDLEKIVQNDIKKQIDQSKQTLLDSGLDKATFRSNEKNDKTAKVSINSVGLAGAKLDAEAIKKQAAGKKKGLVIGSLSDLPGVKDVNISYSPFWVLSTPKKASKISVVIEQPTQIPTDTKKTDAKQ